MWMKLGRKSSFFSSCPHYHRHHHQVKDIMQSNVVALPVSCSLAAVDALLSVYPDAMFPVVNAEMVHCRLVLVETALSNFLQLLLNC